MDATQAGSFYLRDVVSCGGGASPLSMGLRALRSHSRVRQGRANTRAAEAVITSHTPCAAREHLGEYGEFPVCRCCAAGSDTQHVVVQLRPRIYQLFTRHIPLRITPLGLNHYSCQPVSSSSALFMLEDTCIHLPVTLTPRLWTVLTPREPKLCNARPTE